MYESLVMRDGMCNAPATFQHFLNDIFRDLIGKGIWICIDHILVFADSVDELNRLIREVLERLRAHALFLKAKKCMFKAEEVSFLGHVIGRNGIKADPDKLQTIRDFPPPRNLRELRSSLGLFSYYRRFVPRFSEITEVLTDLTKKDVKDKRSDVRQQAFDSLKDALCNDVCLAHFDPTFQTTVYTDDSHLAAGFMIAQTKPMTGVERPIAFYSFKFKGPEINYHIHDKELMPIVRALLRRPCGGRSEEGGKGRAKLYSPRTDKHSCITSSKHLQHFVHRVTAAPGGPALWRVISFRELYSLSKLSSADCYRVAGGSARPTRLRGTVPSPFSHASSAPLLDPLSPASRLTPGGRCLACTRPSH
jgi:hypothetical protein